MKFDKKELMSLLKEGKTSEDLVKEFTNALNSAEKELNQKAEARKKLKTDYADDLASLLVKLNDDLDLGFKGSDLMEYANKTIERLDSKKDYKKEYKKALDTLGRLDKKSWEDAGWTVEKDEYKETPHGYSSYFKAYKGSK